MAGSLENNRSLRTALVRVLGLTFEAPPIVAMLLVSSIGALWATYAGPFPGTSLFAHRPVSTGMLVLAGWLGTYGGVALLLVRTIARDRHRRALEKLALAMLAVVAASIPIFFLEASGVRLHHLRPLAQLAVMTALVILLFRRELEPLCVSARSRPSIALTAVSIWIVVTAAFMVALMDAAIDAQAQGFRLKHAAFFANTLLLGSLYFVAFAVVGRLGTALLIGSALFLVLGFTNLAKMQYMHAAVQPLDVLYLAEFMPQFVATFGTAGAGALLTAAALVVFAIFATWRRKRLPISAGHRAIVGILGLAVLTTASFSQTNAPLRRALEAAGIELADWNSVRSARLNGVLLEFLSFLPDAFLAAPADYSFETVSNTAERFAFGTHRIVASDDQNQKTLIVYMVESLMDPRKLGVGLTADPTPTLHALAAEHSSGYVLVPERFGGSANSEFELLTGMSTAFLPERSIPYKQYVKRPLPSLPCLLASRGYRTIAVQADPVDFFNRPEVYSHLCFQHIAWLQEDPAVPRAINGRAPADEAIVDAVVEAALGAGPAFVFAFPSSTHHPYTLDIYADSDLGLADPAEPLESAELKYYVNTLRTADAAVKRLTDRLSGVEREIIVAIVGDHLPPLSPAALSGFYAAMDPAEPTLGRLLEERRVPLVIWSNFERPREELAFSMNLLGLYLLEQAGIEPEGFLAFVDQFRRHIPIFSRHIAGVGRSLTSPDSAPTEWSQWINDYRLLQYDALLGASHLARAIDAAQRAQVSAMAASSDVKAADALPAVADDVSDTATQQL